MNEHPQPRTAHASPALTGRTHSHESNAAAGRSRGDIHEPKATAGRQSRAAANAPIKASANTRKSH